MDTSKDNAALGWAAAAVIPPLLWTLISLSAGLWGFFTWLAVMVGLGLGWGIFLGVSGRLD